MKQVASAFVKAKKGFSAALKCATNPHFKSRYADLAACVEAVDDSFLDNGIVMYQETFEDDTGVTVETVLLHESGESIRCGKLHVPASKFDPQGFGSALTYARRYSLMAACGIAPEDDDGNLASPQKAKPTQVVKMTESVLADYLATFDSAANIDELKKAFAKAIKAAGSDSEASQKLIAAKDNAKEKLETK